MENRVYISEVSAIPIGEHWSSSIEDLAVAAAHPILSSRPRLQFDSLIIGNMLSGYLNRQENLGAAIADRLGIRGIEAMKVEAACASGAAALKVGYAMIKSGCYSNVLVIGVEKLCDASQEQAVEGLALANDFESETVMGFTNTSLAALLTQNYCEAAGISHRVLGHWAMRGYQKAIHNQYAMFRHGLNLEQYNLANLVSTPLNLYDCPSIADGAVAIALTNEPLTDSGNARVEILAIEGATDSLSITQRKEMLTLESSRLSSHRAMQASQVTVNEIDVLEVHDAFPIVGVLSLEAIGIAEKLHGWGIGNPEFDNSDFSNKLQRLGGIKGRGHPVGATGLYQIVDILSAFHEETSNIHIGMAQCFGGLGANCFTTVLRKRAS